MRPCDAALADAAGAGRLGAAGPAVTPANLCGLPDPLPDAAVAAAGGRDIDVLFVGSVHPARHRDRLPWVARLAALAGRRVLVRSGVPEAEYWGLLGRARLVFNRSAGGRCNRRAFEAAACGAVLLQEADNRELPTYLEPEAEYVPYTAADLEARVHALLNDPDQCARIADRARARVRGYTFDRLVADGLARVDWSAARRRAGDRLAGHRPMPVVAPPAEDGELNRGAAAGDRVATVVLGDRLLAAGRPADAAAELRQAAADLADDGELSPAESDTRFWLAGFDDLRAEWERAGWESAGDPAGERRAKRVLLEWRAHALLAAAGGGDSHWHEAVRRRPDLPAGRAALGCALARAGDPAAAVPHLRAAVAADPLDRVAARACYQAMLDAGYPVAAPPAGPRPAGGCTPLLRPWCRPRTGSPPPTRPVS